MKLINIILLMILSTCFCFAEITSEELNTDSAHNCLLNNELNIGTGETVYSKAKKITGSDHHGIMIRVQSAGTVDLTVTFENGITPSSDFSKPDECTWEWNITSTGDHFKALTNMCHFGFMRFKIISSGENDENTLMDIVISRDTKTN